MGHTGLARLCLVYQYYRTRTRLTKVREAPASLGGGCHVRRYSRYPEPHYDIFNGVITTIGRKYIIVAISPNTNGFLIERQFTIDKDYPERCICPNEEEYEMFEDETMVEKLNEHLELARWFVRYDGRGLSLEQLKQIKNTVKRGK